MKYISSLPTNEYAQTFPRILSICGSTGSIGRSTLQLVDAYPHLFKVHALACGKNIDLLAKQALKYRPSFLVVEKEQFIEAFKQRLEHDKNYDKSYTPTIFFGQEGYENIARLPEVTTFVSAQVGAFGLRSTIAAAHAGKVICLANKESLVLAGNLLREICSRTKAVILPIDSEHHALFQCIKGIEKDDEQEMKQIRSLVLTASGGALRDKSLEFLKQATAEQALNHPNWKMGAKITVDSATLMNKGLEVIEACQLYDVDLSLVEVVVHPQSIIHSMVQYQDYSYIAQLSTPDMRLPIAHCLAYPHMLEGEKADLPKLDLVKLGTLSFESVNNTHFPCLEIAKNAYAEKKCIALNAANEIAVEAFLKKEIYFMQIPELIERILEKAELDQDSLDDILSFDTLYRQKAQSLIKAMN